MTFRVVSLDDEKGWTKHAVVKPREDDPSVWVVLSFHATVYAALRESHRLTESRCKLNTATNELHGFPLKTGLK